MINLPSTGRGTSVFQGGSNLKRMQPTPYPKTGIWCPESNGYVERIVKSLMVLDAKPRLLESKKFSLSSLNLFMYLAVCMLTLLIIF